MVVAPGGQQIALMGSAGCKGVMFVNPNTGEEDMRIKTIAASVLVAVFVLLAACRPAAPQYQCTDEWGCATFKPGEKIKIAYVGPMTGDYSAFGIDISRGAELAVKANPDVLGFPVELLKEDSQGTPEGGAAVANKLAADPKVVAVVGHTFSGSTIAAIPIYEKAHIVMVSPSTTLAKLPELGPEVYHRVAFSDRTQAEMAAKYIYNVLGVRKIVAMHDGGAYGQALAEDVAANFEKLGGTVLGIEGITPGETDYSAVLAKVAALGPDRKSVV